MTRIAVFPGSFDPITIGHEDLVRRAISLFDEIVVAIGTNSSKKYFFPLERRKEMLEQVFADADSVKVETYKGLTVDYCQSIGSNYILRGLRSGADFEFERSIAQMNKAMNNGVETIFLVTNPEYSAINSTIVRDIIRHGGDASPYVPHQLNLNE